VLDGAVVESRASVGPDAVIGRGCRVPRGAAVTDAVVWDGTVLAPGERLERAIAAGDLRASA
jgi:mannose-1-phosphate guanylyltransferase